MISTYWLLASIIIALWYTLATTVNLHLKGSWNFSEPGSDEFRRAGRAAFRGVLFLVGSVGVVFGIGRLIHWLIALS
jgi:hypothetical protein